MSTSITDGDIRALLSYVLDEVAKERRVSGFGPKEAEQLKEAMREVEMTDEEREWFKKLVERKRALSAETLALPPVMTVALKSADIYAPLETYMARVLAKCPDISVNVGELCEAMIDMMAKEGIIGRRLREELLSYVRPQEGEPGCQLKKEGV